MFFKIRDGHFQPPQFRECSPLGIISFFSYGMAQPHGHPEADIISTSASHHHAPAGGLRLLEVWCSLTPQHPHPFLRCSCTGNRGPRPALDWAGGGAGQDLGRCDSCLGPTAQQP